MIHIRIVYQDATGNLFDQKLSVNENTDIKSALAQSEIFHRYPELAENPQVGIFGEQKSLSDKLYDGDRIEIYRPLTLTPIQLRRLKAQKAAEKSTKK